MLPYCYFKSKIVPREEGKISIASHSLQYGTTCFSGIRGYLREKEIRLFRLKDHFDRLNDSAKILGMGFSLEWEDFEKIVLDLVKANAPSQDIYVRPFIYSSDEVLMPRYTGINFNWAIYMMEMGEYHDLSRGIRLMVSSWQKMSNLAFPTKAKAGGAYVNSAIATTEAKNLGFDDALMLNDQGQIVEATTSNLVLVYRNEIFMPPLGSSQLEGITRRTAAVFLEEEGYKIRYEPVDRAMAYVADEILLTGTAAQVVYAHSVDGRVISKDDKPGKIALMLRKKFADLIQGKHARSREWLTPVRY